MSSDTSWEAVQLLAEPTRRALFQACRAAKAPLTREQLATEVGITRRLAAFHLDLLAEAGLLTVDYARPAGRSGPGAGRPAKRYMAAAVDVELSLPARRYDLAARIMARGLATSRTTGGDATEATFSAAHEEGERIGRLRRPRARMSAAATTEATIDALSDLGYEPWCDSEQCVRLANCPFDAAVGEATEVVCGLNEQFVSGLLDGLGGHRDVVASLDPAPGRCCVAVSRRERSRR